MSTKSADPLVRNSIVDSNDITHWLNQENQFATPAEVQQAEVTATLRLLFFRWTEPGDVALPFTCEQWIQVVEEMKLPKSYTRDLHNSWGIPLSLSREGPGTGSSIGWQEATSNWTTPVTDPKKGIVQQTLHLQDSFTSLAFNYDPRNRLTRAFLCFIDIHSSESFQAGAPSVRFLEMLQENAAGISQPLLMPLILADVWIELFKLELNHAENKLVEFQSETQLMDEYLRNSKIIKKGLEFDQLHKNLVQAHAYLTNGFSEFAEAFGPAICSALDQFQEWLDTGDNNREGVEGRHSTFYLKQSTEIITRRANDAVARQNRVLDRINAYLQVLYNLMQQEIARETRRDSSAMKSISLLTMVFLPGTAIATVMAPFTRISDTDGVELTHQFWVFWAVAAPMTAFVLILWMCWIQRSELAKIVTDWKSKGLNRVKPLKAGEGKRGDA
ncbi:Magnesium transport protein CorA [Madurella fahalii]|uniref:Magnesium transport protein CorA n=1 Tax=Madurella fahalii TaxID=1157608 RepID=A0ABQ0FYP8_9PEZI